MVETMAAYENYEYNMDLIEEMFRHIGTSVFGKTVFKVKDQEIDFAPAWRRVQMAELVRQVTGVDFRLITTLEEARGKLTAMGIEEPAASVGEALVLAFEGKAEKTLIQPTLVYGQPVEISPLAKPMADDPRYAERFEIYIAGMECGDNWSEQNDPVRLLNTWKRSYNEGEADSGKFHTLDFDFIEALEYGMPPTTGIGPGVERMAMIFTEQENIDDVIFFPMMRRHVTPTNSAIYGIPTEDPNSAPPTPKAPSGLALENGEFQSLCADGTLKPVSRRLTLTPSLHVWKSASAVRRSGQVIVEGFNADGPLMLSGYRPVAGTSSDENAEAQAFLDLLNAGLVASLKATCPDCEVKVLKPVVVTKVV
jgi:lysyl-tRNA synthetase class 2